GELGTPSSPAAHRGARARGAASARKVRRVVAMIALGNYEELKTDLLRAVRTLRPAAACLSDRAWLSRNVMGSNPTSARSRPAAGVSVRQREGSRAESTHMRTPKTTLHIFRGRPFQKRLSGDLTGGGAETNGR